MPAPIRKAHQSQSEDDNDSGEGSWPEEGAPPADNSNSNNHGAVLTVTPLPAAARWVPSCLRFDDAPVEATGCAVDDWAMGPIFMSSLFLGPALLQLATQAAGCDFNDDPDIDTPVCENKVYGFRPSSLLSNMAVVSGLLVPLLLPLVGAVLDHTPHRKGVAAATALGLAALKGLEAAVGRHTWFTITILQVLSSVLYNIHVTATYAYKSELGSAPAVQASYQSFYSATQYASMLLFLLAVLVSSGLAGADNVGTARISQTITCATAGTLFRFAWKHLFREVPAAIVLPPGVSLWTSGFRKVAGTTLRIASHRQYRPLLWVILSLSFAEAAMSALATVATTYLTAVLKMDATEVGLLFLIVLLMGIPGSRLGGWTMIAFGSPIRSGILCNAVFVVVTGAAATLLTGPEHKLEAYGLASLWGICLGWLSPVDTTMFLSVMPGNACRAEFMGIYMLAVYILSWLPPLVFSGLNEAGLPMAYGLASLNLFFLAGLGFLLPVGDDSQRLSPHMELVPTQDADEDNRNRELT
jgi:UMF1 family MFS transporter